MNKRAQFFLLTNVGIVLIQMFLMVSSIFMAGCSDSESDWKPGDQDQIRKLVSEISDARTNKDKLANIFLRDAVPDKNWLKQTYRYSFVVSDIAIESDQASVIVDLENHFGEIQKTVTWTCSRTDEGWRIASAPME